MKIRLAVMGVCLVFCLAGLIILAFLAQKDRNLFLILPSDIGSTRLDVQKAEEFAQHVQINQRTQLNQHEQLKQNVQLNQSIENEFPLTYEIIGSEQISLSYAEFQVTQIETNSNYPHILGLTMSEGSFFSAQAWKGKQRHAVLNEKAAFTIFGSYKIIGSRFKMRDDTWLITGVISDGDKDNSRVYIPSSIQGGEIEELALKSTGGLNEALIKNSVKNLGIQEKNFIFINFGTQYSLLWERIKVILLLFLGLLLLSFLQPLIISFKKAYAAIKKDLECHYPGEIIKKNKKSVFKLLFLILSILLLPSFALFFLLHIVSVCIPWQDIPSLGSLNQSIFYPYIARQRNLELISCIFFGISLAILGTFFISLNIFLWKKTYAK